MLLWQIFECNALGEVCTRLYFLIHSAQTKHKTFINIKTQRFIFRWRALPHSWFNENAYRYKNKTRSFQLSVNSTSRTTEGQYQWTPWKSLYLLLSWNQFYATGSKSESREWNIKIWNRKTFHVLLHLKKKSTSASRAKLRLTFLYKSPRSTAPKP